MKKEVSCRALTQIHVYLSDLGVAPERLYEGLAVNFAYASVPSNWIEWDTFAELMDRVERLVGTEHIEKMGESGPKPVKKGEYVGINDVTRRLVALFASSKLIYRTLIRWVCPKLFPVIRTSYEEVSENQVRLVFEIPEGYRECKPFFYVWLGGVRGSPAALGQSDALVVSEITPFRGEFLVTAPPSLTIWDRIKRAWKVLFFAKTAMTVIAEQQAEMKRHYDELFELQRKVMEQDLKLKLSGQMATLSKYSALGEMAGGVAHEINNPLGILSLKTGQIKDMALLGSLDPTGLVKEIEVIEATVSRIAKIIRALRIFSRDASKDPPQRIRIGELVNSTLQMCEERFKQDGVSVERDFRDLENLEVECRPTEVTQALFNLLTNAHDFVLSRPEKWIRVEIRETAEAVQIGVVDSGQGVAPEARDKLFQPFFTTKPVGAGTGLGLSVARGVVESNEGTIEYDRSSPNTRFVVTLKKKLSQSAHKPVNQEKPF